MPITTCVFDAYGTLFDVSAAARKAAAHPQNAAIAKTWEKLAATWRDKQLEYTWLRAITGDHTDFWQVTQDALDFTLEAMDLHDAALRAELLRLYEQLDAYADAAPILAALKASGRTCAILSNGSPAMLDQAVRSAKLTEYLDAILSVEEVGVFKPDARVYAMVEGRFSVPPSETLFISSNGWDIAGAARFGFNTLWVNRSGRPVDRLPGRPDATHSDLTHVLEVCDNA